MATELFKGQHSQWFKAHRVQGMLEAGWTTQPTVPVKEKDESEKDLREKAKEAGISHYWTKSVATLKAELYGEDNVDPV